MDGWVGDESFEGAMMYIATVNARTTHGRILSKRLFMYRHLIFILLIDLAVRQTKMLMDAEIIIIFSL